MTTHWKNHAILAGLLLWTAFAASAVPVTFQVDMSVQAELAKFDPTADTVQLMGSFDNWTAGIALANTVEAPAIFTGVLDDSTDAPGSTVQYKFVMNGSGWESIGNRSFMLTSTTQTLPVVFFNDLPVAPGAGIPVTFQVDLSVQTALGNFDAANDTVEARGVFNNWAGGFTLTKSVANSNIYTGTFVETTEAPGSGVAYKFVIVSAANNLVWEGINNRNFVLASSDQTLPVVFFNNLSKVPGNGIAVTFRVNMGPQIAAGSFNPETDIVEARGPFNNWLGGFTLSPSATDTNVYVGTTHDKTDAPGNPVGYKFVINGGNWEGGNNHLFTLANSPQSIPTSYFNGIAPSDLDIGLLAIGSSSVGKVTVSWNGVLGLRLQSSTDLGSDAWQDVSNSDGQTSMTFDIGPHAFFRLFGP